MPSVLWARVVPWDKEIAVAALESGVDALWVPDEALPLVRGIGRVAAVCAGGDIREGRDFRIVRMEGKKDEDEVRNGPPEMMWVVRPGEKEIIPLENLVAWRRKILVEARTPEEVEICAGILEKGVHGIVLSAEGPAAMRRLVAAARRDRERIPLVAARVTDVAPLGIGDRVCVDTCTVIEGSRGMLVGNSSGGLFLVCAENAPNPYVNPRPFRVNAGGVHSYVRLPGGRTAYLSELAAGEKVLVVGEDGTGETAVVGRVKVERRPLLLVRAETPSGAVHSVILQNAETIRLVGPGGAAVSMSRIGPGEGVLVMEEAAGRHFGVAVEETIREK